MKKLNDILFTDSNEEDFDFIGGGKVGPKPKLNSADKRKLRQNGIKPNDVLTLDRGKGTSKSSDGTQSFDLKTQCSTDCDED